MLIHTPNMSTQQIPFVVTLSKIVSFFILHLDSMMQRNTPLLIIKRKPRMLKDLSKVIQQIKELEFDIRFI